MKPTADVLFAQIISEFQTENTIGIERAFEGNKHELRVAAKSCDHGGNVAAILPITRDGFTST